MENELDTIVKQASSLQSTTSELVKRYNDLRIFEEAAIWDSDALAVIALFEQIKEVLQQYKRKQEKELMELEATRVALPFAKRIFASQADEKRIKEDISEVIEGFGKIDAAIEDLYDLIDRTPNSREEQTQMLQDLRQEKKELTLEKRALNEDMRAVKIKARQDTAKMTGQTGAVARYSRAYIRRQKEAELGPQEDAKAGIERQLIDIERRINWISRFYGDDPQPQFIEYVLRCAYCGRRIEENSVCPGCGSDRTIRS